MGIKVIKAIKIKEEQDINNYNNNRSGRDIVNSTKVIMKKGGN